MTSVHSEALKTLRVWESSDRPQWGVEALDEATGGIYPDLNLIAGGAHGGKTSFALSVAMANPQAKILLFSPDEGHEFALSKLLAWELDVKPKEMRAILADESDADIPSALARVEDRWFISENCSPGEMDKLYRRAQLELGGVDLVIYDYVGSYGDSISTIDWKIDSLKAFSRRCMVPVLGIHQSVKGGMDPDVEPTLAMLDTAGHKQAFAVVWAKPPSMKKFDAGTKRMVQDEATVAKFARQPWIEIYTLKNKRGPMPPKQLMAWSAGSRLTEWDAAADRRARGDSAAFRS